MDIPDTIEDQIDDKGGLEDIGRSVPEEGEIIRRSSVYKALSDPIRLRVMYLLQEQDLCVCCIKELVNMPDSNLSYHLTRLKEAGLIRGKQEKNRIIYQPTERAWEVLQ